MIKSLVGIAALSVVEAKVTGQAMSQSTLATPEETVHSSSQWSTEAPPQTRVTVSRPKTKTVEYQVPVYWDEPSYGWGWGWPAFNWWHMPLPFPSLFPAG